MLQRAILALGVAYLLVPFTAAQDLLLTNARIVDPATQGVRQQHLLIRAGTIVATPPDIPTGFDGETLDLSGKWVIPGLNDLHTHSYGNMGPDNTFDAPGSAAIAHRLLYAGVTGFVDLFGAEDALYTLREQQRNGEAGGADLYASLSCLTATEGHCTEYGTPTRVMDSPDDARRVVADLAQKHPDVVKIVYAPTGRMPSIDKATLAAAVATASANGIKTVLHINTWQDISDAIEVGASAVTHVPRGPIPDGLARRMAAHGLASIPTLSVQTELTDFLFDPAVLDAPLARTLTSDALIGAYRSDALVARFADRQAGMVQDGAAIRASVAALAEAGVLILTGTDAGNWGTIQGYSMHRELLKLVQAGLTPWQALAAATTNAGAFLGRRFGVQPGDAANLVVLHASPIEDIANTQQIAFVIHHGRVVDRDGALAAGGVPTP